MTDKYEVPPSQLPVNDVPDDSIRALLSPGWVQTTPNVGSLITDALRRHKIGVTELASRAHLSTYRISAFTRSVSPAHLNVRQAKVIARAFGEPDLARKLIVAQESMLLANSIMHAAAHYSLATQEFRAWSGSNPNQPTEFKDKP